MDNNTENSLQQCIKTFGHDSLEGIICIIFQYFLSTPIVIPTSFAAIFAYLAYKTHQKHKRNDVEFELAREFHKLSIIKDRIISHHELFSTVSEIKEYYFRIWAMVYRTFRAHERKLINDDVFIEWFSIFYITLFYNYRPINEVYSLLSTAPRPLIQNIYIKLKQEPADKEFSPKKSELCSINNDTFILKPTPHIPYTSEFNAFILLLLKYYLKTDDGSRLEIHKKIEQSNTLYCKEKKYKPYDEGLIDDNIWNTAIKNKVKKAKNSYKKEARRNRKEEIASNQNVT